MADTFAGVAYGPDYPLNGPITYFESYMFATKDKFVEQHGSFDEEIVIVDGSRGVETVSMMNLGDRKAALSKFNRLAKSQGLSTQPKDYSCVMIDFVSDSPDMDPYDLSYQEIKKVFVDWAMENDRVAVMTQHFYQYDRTPHVHLLIQRGARKHDEFQKYLDSCLC